MVVLYLFLLVTDLRYGGCRFLVTRARGEGGKNNKKKEKRVSKKNLPTVYYSTAHHDTRRVYEPYSPSKRSLSRYSHYKNNNINNNNKQKKRKKHLIDSNPAGPDRTWADQTVHVNTETRVPSFYCTFPSN